MVSWEVRTNEPGDFYVVIDYEKKSTLAQMLQVTIGEDCFPAPLTITPLNDVYHLKKFEIFDHKPQYTVQRLGVVHFKDAGIHQIQVTALGAVGEYPVSLRRLRLIPTRTTPLEKSEIRYS